MSDIDIHGTDLSSSFNALIQICGRIKKMNDFTFATPVDVVKDEPCPALAAERADQIHTAVVTTMVSLAALIHV